MSSHTEIRTNAERQRRKREKLAARGLVQCNIWVPHAAHADIHLMAEIMQKFPHLTVGPLRDPATGKLVALRTKREAPSTVTAQSSITVDGA